MTKIKVQGLNVEVTEALETHTQEQLGKLIANFESIIVEDITVTLDVDAHHSHIQKATIKVPVRGNDVVVDDQESDMYKAITSATQKAIRSVRKVKEKSQHKKGGNKRAPIVDEE